MKRTFSTTVMLCALSFYGAAQADYSKTIFTPIELTETTSLEVNLDGYSMDQVGEFKDLLLSYDEKVISVVFVEKTNTLVVTYNGHMLLEDLIDAFEKNGINYLKEPKQELHTNSHH